MNVSSDAAEQIVRMSLEGMEVAIKISGQGAKLAAVRIAAALNEEQKTRGKARLTAMLKSGKPLKVYEIQQKDLKTFAQEAKRYGVLYTVLKDKNNHADNATIDIISRVEDASKIQRITERFRLTTVDAADVTKTDRDRLFPSNVNPTTARTERDDLSGPDSKERDSSQSTISNSDKPSVKEKLEQYRKETDKAKEELVKSAEKNLACKLPAKDSKGR